MFIPRRFESTMPALRSWVRWWLTVDSVSPSAHNVDNLDEAITFYRQLFDTDRGRDILPLTAAGGHTGRGYAHRRRHSPVVHLQPDSITVNIDACRIQPT